MKILLMGTVYALTCASSNRVAVTVLLNNDQALTYYMSDTDARTLYVGQPLTIDIQPVSVQ